MNQIKLNRQNLIVNNKNQSLKTEYQKIITTINQIQRECDNVLQINSTLDISKYHLWSQRDVIQWILSLENNRLKQYDEALIAAFKLQNVDGSCLIDVEISDIKDWGIKNIEHQMFLLQQIHELSKQNDAIDDESDDEKKASKHSMELNKNDNEKSEEYDVSLSDEDINIDLEQLVKSKHYNSSMVSDEYKHIEIALNDIKDQNVEGNDEKQNEHEIKINEKQDYTHSEMALNEFEIVEENSMTLNEKQYDDNPMDERQQQLIEDVNTFYKTLFSFYDGNHDGVHEEDIRHLISSDKNIGDDTQLRIYNQVYNGIYDQVHNANIKLNNTEFVNLLKLIALEQENKNSGTLFNLSIHPNKAILIPQLLYPSHIAVPIEFERIRKQSDKENNNEKKPSILDNDLINFLEEENDKMNDNIEYVTYIGCKDNCYSFCKYIVMILIIGSTVFSGIVCIGYWRDIISIPFQWFFITLIYFGSLVIVLFAVCCIFGCISRSNCCDSNLLIIQQNVKHRNKSQYLLKFIELIENKTFGKQKLLLLLDIYQTQIYDEWEQYKNEMNEYSDKIQDNIQNIFLKLINKYSLQTAIAGYYEIVMILHGLVIAFIPSSVAECNNNIFIITQWSLFGTFFLMGITAQIQQSIHHPDRPSLLYQTLTTLMGSIILFILFMAIDLRPFDCYYHNKFYLQMMILGLGIFTFIIDQIIHCKYKDEIHEGEEIKKILVEMKQKINKFVEYEQFSANLLFDSELNAIKSALNTLKTHDQRLLSHYFNVLYYYLQQQFGSVISLSSSYAIITFILNILFEYNKFNISDKLQRILQWSVFGFFVLISFIISIKKSSFNKFSLFLQITYWTKKHIWSFFICVSLIIAVESKPISYYIDDIFLNCLVIISLLLSILGHIYFPSIYHCSCNNRRKGNQIKHHHFEIEMHPYEHVDIPNQSIDMFDVWQQQNVSSKTLNVDTEGVSRQQFTVPLQTRYSRYSTPKLNHLNNRNEVNNNMEGVNTEIAVVPEDNDGCGLQMDQQRKHRLSEPIQSNLDRYKGRYSAPRETNQNNFTERGYQ